MSKFKIVVATTGSIATYKVAHLVSTLVKEGHQVQCIGTKSSTQFIGEATWEGLTGRPFLIDVFAKEQMMKHIELAKWGDRFLLAPASANTLCKLRAGLADDLVGSLWLAIPKIKPVYLAPAMNVEMWSHPAVKNAISELTDWGYQIIGPDKGLMACGDQGEGRLIEPDEIMKVITSEPTPKGRVLITGGGTQEAIDDIRCISNHSTGRTAAGLAQTFVDQQWTVDYLHGAHAQKSGSKVHHHTFHSHGDLKKALLELICKNTYDLVIHAAAVSDYKPVGITDPTGRPLIQNGGKVDSQQDEIFIRLKRTEKLIDQILQNVSRQHTRVVAFKLTSGASTTTITRQVDQLLSGGVEAVVHNDWQKRKSGQDIFTIFSQTGKPLEIHGLNQLAIHLMKSSVCLRPQEQELNL